MAMARSCFEVLFRREIVQQLEQWASRKKALMDQEKSVKMPPSCDWHLPDFGFALEDKVNAALDEDTSGELSSREFVFPSFAFATVGLWIDQLRLALRQRVDVSAIFSVLSTITKDNWRRASTMHYLSENRSLQSRDLSFADYCWHNLDGQEVTWCNHWHFMCDQGFAPIVDDVITRCDNADRALMARSELLDCLNSQNGHGDTALMLTASKGHDEIVDRLLRSGADLNHTNRYGSTALSIAIRGGRRNVAYTLAKQPSIEVDTKDKWGDFPLYLASGGFGAAVSDIELVSLILARSEHGPHSQDSRFEGPEHPQGTDWRLRTPLTEGDKSRVTADRQGHAGITVH